MLGVVVSGTETPARADAAVQGAAKVLQLDLMSFALLNHTNHIQNKS